MGKNQGMLRKVQGTEKIKGLQKIKGLRDATNDEYLIT
jgi:hypothetical protein